MKTIFLAFFVLVLNMCFAQREPIDRATGKKIPPCEVWDCSDQLSDPEYAQLTCLKCFCYQQDSIMIGLTEKIRQKLKVNPIKLKEFNLQQSSWESKANQRSDRAGDPYKGGTMEVTEIFRVYYVLHRDRNMYLSKLLKMLEN